LSVNSKKDRNFLIIGVINMITNHSESFDHVLKGACTLHVFTLVQFPFNRNNAYLVTQKGNAYDFITYGVIWPSVVQLELYSNKDR